MIIIYLLSATFAKKRWKNLRDTYLRRKREEKGRSGDAGGKKKEWKYKQVMGFLEPFIDTAMYCIS